jgi:hypothetical protein
VDCRSKLASHLRVGDVEVESGGAKRKKEAIFAETLLTDALCWGQCKHVFLDVVKAVRREDGCRAYLACSFGRKVSNVVNMQHNFFPGFFSQLDAARVLSERPRLAQNKSRRVVLDFATDLVDHRKNAIPEYGHVRRSKERRIPHVNHALNCLVVVLDGQPYEQEDEVSGNNVQISVVDVNLSSLNKPRWQTCDSLDDVPQITGSYIVCFSILFHSVDLCEEIPRTHRQTEGEDLCRSSPLRSQIVARHHEPAHCPIGTDS